MNDVEESIYAVLSADSALQTLTGGRIYAVNPPIDPSMPFVQFTCAGVSGEAKTPLSGANVIRPWEIKIDTLGKRLSQVAPIANRIQSLLNAYSGGSIRGVFFRSKEDQQEMSAEGEIYQHQQQTFVCWA